MTLSPDAVLQKLREIAARLDEARGANRDDLLRQRDELRSLARTNHLLLSDPDTLRRELAHAQARLDELDREPVQIPNWQKHTGGRLSDPAAAGVQINRRLNEFNATERESLEQRIDEIQQILDDGETA